MGLNKRSGKTGSTAGFDGSFETHQNHHVQGVDRWPEYGTEAELPDSRMESRHRRSGQEVSAALKNWEGSALL